MQKVEGALLRTSGLKYSPMRGLICINHSQLNSKQSYIVKFFEIEAKKTAKL
jgi:hypothetical protein